MSTKTRVGLLAGAAALTLTGVSSARPAVEGAHDDMASRLAAAEAKIAAMEAAQNQNWLTEQRAQEIRGLVQDVLADADTRASLLQAGATSGYDNGFVLGDTGGNFLLRTNFLMQQRFLWNNNDADSGDNDRWGFENTRSKFMLSGHVVNPDWYYRVDVNVGTNGGGSPLLDQLNISDDRQGTLNAYLGHNYGNGWKVQMGSMKLPILREELVPAEHQLAVERSNVNYIFTGGYADGVALMYESDQFRFAGMLSDGVRTGQTIWSTFDTEYAVTGRVEFLASGNWDQFNDFTSPRDGEAGILIGAAGHYEMGEFGSPASELELILLTADASLEFGGANLHAALVWADMSFNGVAGPDLNPWGFNIQGGWYMNDTWELFGRFEWIETDVPDEDEVKIATVGVNKYFSGHNAKWTTDLGYAFDSLVTLVPANITGMATDATDDDDGQLVFRTQWQLLF